MSTSKITRRKALATASAGTIASMTGWPFTSFTIASGISENLAIKGGIPVRSKPWPSWPIWDKSAEDDIAQMFQSGKWYRNTGNYCDEFEAKYAELIGFDLE